MGIMPSNTTRTANKRNELAIRAAWPGYGAWQDAIIVRTSGRVNSLAACRTRVCKGSDISHF